MQSNTKFRPIIESLGFKKKRPLPLHIRTERLDDLQQYEKKVQVTDPERLKRMHGEIVNYLRDCFYLSNLPIIGRRCVGLYRIKEFDDEFDIYLHI
ncbi:MAG: hypothetical protein ACLFM7_13800 [Bacteroidales bacterium]